MPSWLESLHFLRPWWLLAAVPAMLVWWMLIRSRDPRQSFKGQIAPHLLDQLLVAPKEQTWLRPTTLLLPLWLVGVMALAGPSWRREPSPFAEDEAGLMLVVRVAPSMETDDLQPSRLERVRIKVNDLLELRPAGRTGLIAYSGSAHLVMPFTDDAEVITHMMEALDPSVMPKEGDVLADALMLASKRILDSGRPASILVITDGVETQQLSSLGEWRAEKETIVQFLVALSNSEAVAASGVEPAAKSLRAVISRLAPDDSDLTAINRRAERAVVATPADAGTRWRDEGYLLGPLLLLGLAVWLRRGWSVTLD